jgi:hypothetical protein
MVASKRHEELYWFRPEPYVQSKRRSSTCSSLECSEVLTIGVQEWWSGRRVELELEDGLPK